MKRCQAPLVINCFTYNSRTAPVFSYVSQLVPLPKSFEERFGLYSVLRIPQCMRTSDIYHLHELGGPKLRSISIACAAATYRTALTTVTSGPNGFPNLKSVPNNFCLSPSLLRGTLHPVTGIRTPWPLTLNMHTMVSPTTPCGLKEEPSSQQSCWS